MANARGEVAAFWDAELARWAAGDTEMSPDLVPWFRSYEGKGAGAVDLLAFPEPFIGPLVGREPPPLVMLGLNPGGSDHAFQGQDGVFTRQVAATSYSQWARSAPYSGPAWEAAHGVNKYHRARLKFAQRLRGNPAITPEQLLYFELYPFHSRKVSAPIRPPRDVLDRFVFGPLGEIDTEFIFAFGKDWLDVATKCGWGTPVPVEARWSAGTRRCCRTELPSGQQLISFVHQGSAAPPAAHDVGVLRAILS